jgi:hypothetical protein
MKNYVILKVIASLFIWACSISAFAQQKYETTHVAIVSEICDKAMIKSFAHSMEEVRRIATDNGFEMPERMELHITRKPGIDKMILFSDSPNTIQLYYPDEYSFKDKVCSHNTNTYGICHEIGHMIINPYLGGADDFSVFVIEAWAHLFGSMANDMVYERYKKNLWQEQFDYREFGMKRFLEGLSDNTDYSQVQHGWLELYCKVGFNNMSGFLTDLATLIKQKKSTEHALAVAVFSYLAPDDAQNWIKQYSGVFLDRSNESISLYSLYVQQYY